MSLNKIPYRHKLREEGYAVAHSFRGISVHLSGVDLVAIRWKEYVSEATLSGKTRKQREQAGNRSRYKLEVLLIMIYFCKIVPMS